MTKDLRKCLNHVESALARVSPHVNDHNTREPTRYSELEAIEKKLREAGALARKELQARTVAQTGAQF